MPHLGILVIACCLTMSAGGALAEKAPDPKWMAHCAHNLGERHLPEAAVNAYCVCMAGVGDDDEMLDYSQKKLEASFPWVHKRCVKRAADAMAVKS